MLDQRTCRRAEDCVAAEDVSSGRSDGCTGKGAVVMIGSVRCRRTWCDRWLRRNRGSGRVSLRQS